MKNEICILKPHSGKVIFCAVVHGEFGHATIYMDDITPERLREAANEMENMKGDK